jgi:hypothetical protein
MVEQEEGASSAECILPVAVTKIARNTLLQLLEKDPASGLVFFRHLSRIIGQRLVNLLQGHPVRAREKKLAVLRITRG